MPTLRKATKPKTPVDPDVHRSRIEKAMATLKRSVFTAMQLGLIPKSLVHPLCVLDESLATALPPKPQVESEARLPF